MSLDKIDFTNKKERHIAFLIKIVQTEPSCFPKTLQFLPNEGSARQFLKEVKLLSLNDDDTDIEKPIIFFINFLGEFSKSFDLMGEYLFTLDEAFRQRINQLLDEFVLIFVFLRFGEDEELLDEIFEKTALRSEDIDDILVERLDTLETEIFSLLNDLYERRK